MTQDARTITSTALGLALVGGVAATIAMASAAQADTKDKVTICHATGADDKWVVITVDAASILDGKGQAGSGRNVIPPFVHTDGKGGNPVTYPGLNWHDNWETDGHGVPTEPVRPVDCLGGETGPEPTPATSVTVTPSVAPSASPDVTPTDVPDVSETATPTPTVTETDGPSATPTPTVVVPTPTVTETGGPSVAPTPTVVVPTPTVTETGGPEGTETATPTPTVTTTSPTPTTAVPGTVTPIPTPDVTVTPPGLPASGEPEAPVTDEGSVALPPTGPVVETDLVTAAGPRSALVAGGSALTLLGIGATLLGARRGRQLL